MGVEDGVVVAELLSSTVIRLGLGTKTGHGVSLLPLPLDFCPKNL